MTTTRSFKRALFLLLITLASAAPSWADDPAQNTQTSLRFDLGGGTGTSGAYGNGILKFDSPNFDASFGEQAGLLIGGGTLLKDEGCQGGTPDCGSFRLIKLNYTNRYWDFNTLEAGPTFVQPDGTKFRVVVNPFGARGARAADSDLHWHPSARFEFDKSFHDNLFELIGTVEGGLLYESVNSQGDVGTTVNAVLDGQVNYGRLSLGVEINADTQDLKEVKNLDGDSIRPDRSFTDVGVNAYARATF